MKAPPRFIFAAILLLMSAKPVVPQDPPKAAPLRRPGFLFLELGTARVDDYVDYFQAVAEFRLIRKQKGYAELESGLGELLIMDPAGLPQGHPFHGKLSGSGQGLGVEIGLVVADLDKTFASAIQFKDWKISSPIARRPWGVRDFRVLTPDGYYLRFTEGPK